MIYIVIFVVLIVLFIILEFFSIKKEAFVLKNRKSQLLRDYERLKKEDALLKDNVVLLEKRMSRCFFFYDVTKRLAPYLSKGQLLSSFSEELKYLGEVDDVRIEKIFKEEGYYHYHILEGEKDELYLRTSSEDVLEYIPYFIKLLRLCLERVNLYEKLQQLSIYDFLTNVYNRRYFMQRFFEEFTRAQEFNLKISLLMIDIDHFKQINDAYGHLVGDIVLSKVAESIKDTIRTIDFMGRFGGEEFAIILLDTDRVGAIMVGERICNKIAKEEIRVFDDIIKVTVSVGIANFPYNASYPNMVIEIADKAMYKAKMSGRNKVCWC